MCFLLLFFSLRKSSNSFPTGLFFSVLFVRLFFRLNIEVSIQMDNNKKLQFFDRINFFLSFLILTSVSTKRLKTNFNFMNKIWNSNRKMWSNFNTFCFVKCPTKIECFAELSSSTTIGYTIRIWIVNVNENRTLVRSVWFAFSVSLFPFQIFINGNVVVWIAVALVDVVVLCRVAITFLQTQFIRSNAMQTMSSPCHSKCLPPFTLPFPPPPASLSLSLPYDLNVLIKFQEIDDTIKWKFGRLFLSVFFTLVFNCWPT